MATTAKRSIAEPQSAETKEGLTSWWSKFKSKPARKEIDAARSNHSRSSLPCSPLIPIGIFSVPLQESIIYANVAISLYNSDGQTFIYGYIPIVVAKCGLFLKDNATETEGIFRLSGSAKRIKDLQAIFDQPPKYGKGLDWTGFTVHDAANILRRYLNHLPDPIIPYDWYNPFRQPLKEGWPIDKTIPRMQELVASLPPLNRQLLLYILDLLAVFASKAEINRMTSENLSAIFQPGLITHPSHDMAPQEYRLSQEVLVFLIDNQAHFLLDTLCAPTTDQAPSPPSIKKSSLLRRRTLQAPKRSPSVRQPSPSGEIFAPASRAGNIHASSPLPTSRTNSKSGSLSRSNTVPTKRNPPARSLASPDQASRHVSTPTVLRGTLQKSSTNSGQRPDSLMQDVSRIPQNEYHNVELVKRPIALLPDSTTTASSNHDPLKANKLIQRIASPTASNHSLQLKSEVAASHTSDSVSTSNNAAQENVEGQRSRRTSRGSGSIANDAEFSILGGRKGTLDPVTHAVGTPSGGTASIVTIPSTASTSERSQQRPKENKIGSSSPSKFSNLFKKKPRHQSISSTSEAGGRRDLDK